MAPTGFIICLVYDCGILVPVPNVIGTQGFQHANNIINYASLSKIKGRNKYK